VINNRSNYSICQALGLAVLGMASLSACVATPAHPLQNLTQLNVSQVPSNGANGELVKWGGTIAVINNSDDSTTVEIVSRPLSEWGRPIRNDQTDGRFIARINEVLDPQEVRRGMDITLLGLLTEIKDGSIGETPYEFPVIDVEKLKIWKPQNQSVPCTVNTALMLN